MSAILFPPRSVALHDAAPSHGAALATSRIFALPRSTLSRRRWFHFHRRSATRNLVEISEIFVVQVEFAFKFILRVDAYNPVGLIQESHSRLQIGDEGAVIATIP